MHIIRLEQLAALIHALQQERNQRGIVFPREIGVDPRRLLGRAGVTIDAEFEQVGTSAGLEDLLGDDE